MSDDIIFMVITTTIPIFYTGGIFSILWIKHLHHVKSIEIGTIERAFTATPRLFRITISNFNLNKSGATIQKMLDNNYAVDLVFCGIFIIGCITIVPITLIKMEGIMETMLALSIFFIEFSLISAFFYKNILTMKKNI